MTLRQTGCDIIQPFVRGGTFTMPRCLPAFGVRPSALNDGSCLRTYIHDDPNKPGKVAEELHTELVL